MSKLQVKIYDCETGEETLRDATSAEAAQIKAELVIKAEQEAEAKAKAQAKAALLDRLGITEDEAKLLLS